MSPNDPGRKNGPDQSNSTAATPEFDEAVALDLAVDRLLNQLSGPETHPNGDFAQLIDRVNEITRKLERGEELDPNEMELAKFYAGEVQERLEEAALLHGYTRRDIGVSWGELSEAEREEVRERDDR